MGTERSLEHEGPCQCGKGHVRVYECTPDHGWPVAERVQYEGRVDCADCSTAFAMEERLERAKRKFVLVRAADVAERERLNAEARHIWSIAEGCDGAQAAKAEFARRLDECSSIAAAYRMAISAGLFDGTEGTFRRHWRGGAAFVKGLHYPPKVRKLFAPTGVDSTEFDGYYSKYEQLKKAAEQPLGIVQEVYAISVG